MFDKFKKAVTQIIALAFAVVAPAAFAVDPPAGGGGAHGVDLSSLTNSVNFGSVLTGIMAVAVSLIALYAGSAGVRWILRMVRGA